MDQADQSQIPPDATSAPQPPAQPRRRRGLAVVVSILLVLLLAAIGAGAYADLTMAHRLDAISRELSGNAEALRGQQEAVGNLSGGLRALGTQESELGTQLSQLGNQVSRNAAAQAANTLNAPVVAARVAPSVFTIQATAGQGTGFAFTTDGVSTYVVTNYHVIAQDTFANHDTVVLVQGGNDYTGQVWDWSKNLDVADVKVTGKLFPILTSANLVGRPPNLGEPVLAYNSQAGLANTVTTGVISGLNRTVSEVNDAGNVGVTINGAIQTSAPINPGASGGPLVDNHGYVLGITFAGVSSAQDIGFAIPVSDLCPALFSSGC